MLSPRARLLQERVGHCIRMPAPSPVLASQPHAPRCWRLRNTCSACWTIGVRLLALDVDDKADAAGFVFKPRVVQALARLKSLFTYDPSFLPFCNDWMNDQGTR